VPRSIPHFLFNALNAIAGLLHRDPATADRTIEKLADVFRYTLRGSESEWATLDDELEFVRAYLDVEESRFGDRLQARLEVAPGARRARVPTMIVHTLVENAVKHGASAVRGRAVIEIGARARDGRCRSPSATTARVRPAAPGAAAERRLRPGEHPRAPRRALRRGGRSTSSRDDAAGRTTVTVSIPLLTVEPPRLAGASR
jgi:two-component sensor histidine kinase